MMFRFSIICAIFYCSVAISQQQITLENGRVIVINPDKTWEYIEIVTSNEPAGLNDLELRTNLVSYMPVWLEPKLFSLRHEDFNFEYVEVLDHRRDFFKVRDRSGRIGYVQSLGSSENIRSEILKRAVNKAREQGKKFVIRDVYVEEINSVGGVDFRLEWLFLDEAKAIKYVYFTVVPFNAVGDVLSCDISGHTSFIGKVTGPVQAGSDLQTSSWGAAWYNSTTACIIVTKVKIEYMDGTSYTYIKELPKILDEGFGNSCLVN